MTYACLFPLIVLLFTRCARPTNALHSPSIVCSTADLASFLGLPHFCSSVCVQYNTQKFVHSATLPLPCIVLNTNRSRTAKEKNSGGLGTRLAVSCYSYPYHLLFTQCCGWCWGDGHFPREQLLPSAFLPPSPSPLHLSIPSPGCKKQRGV